MYIMQGVETKKKAKWVLKRKYKVLIAVFMILALITNIGGLYIGNIYYQEVCRLNVNPATTGIDYYKSSFNYERFKQLESYNVSVKSSFGYTLSGTYVFNPKPTNNTVILVHGIGCCLLYTSDAADEEDSVDLGGRRIIKKKKQNKENKLTT